MTDRQLQNRINKINTLKAEVAKLNAQVNTLQDEIKGAMGDEQQVTTKAGFNIFWRWKKAAEKFDTDRFKEAEPDLYKKYLTTGKATREFRITKPGKATA